MRFTSTLPPEVWGMIATEADPNDQANLRLTSRSMCAAATRPFGLSRLAHRRFIVSPHSLQALIELTSHPVLGPCMASISLGTYRMDERHELRPAELDDTNTNDNTNINDDTNTNEAAHLAAVTQRSIERHGHFLDALKQALTNLKCRKIRIGLGIHDDLVDDLYYHYDETQDPDWRLSVTRVTSVRRAYGFDELYGRLNLRRVGRREADGTLLALHHATQQSTYDFSALSLDLEKQFYESEGGWGTVLLPTVKAMVISKESSTPVRDLTMKFCEDLARPSRGLCELAFRTRGDRSMEIEGYALLNDPDWNEYVCPIPYGLYTVVLCQDYFEKIVLKKLTIDATFSDPFFRSHLNTLRHLELRGVSLYGLEDSLELGLLNLWRALMKLRRLEVLVLDGLDIENTDPPLDPPGIHFDGEVTLRGAEIRVGLQKIILKTEDWLYNSNRRDERFDMARMVEYTS
jgi:hypothetical protein